MMRIWLLSILLLAGCGSSGDSAATGDAPASAADLETFCDRLPRSAYASLDKHPASTELV